MKRDLAFGPTAEVMAQLHSQRLRSLVAVERIVQPSERRVETSQCDGVDSSRSQPTFLRAAPSDGQRRPAAIESQGADPLGTPKLMGRNGHTVSTPQRLK